jgi:hypothetical protein
MMSETNKADARGATPDRLMSRALLTFYVLAPTRVAISRLAAHSRIAVLWLAAAVLALGTLWGACSSKRRSARQKRPSNLSSLSESVSSAALAWVNDHNRLLVPGPAEAAGKVHVSDHSFAHLLDTLDHVAGRAVVGPMLD